MFNIQGQVQYNAWGWHARCWLRIQVITGCDQFKPGWLWLHWNGNVFILMKFSSLAALKVVKMTTSSAASDENFVKMTTFSFQCKTGIYYEATITRILFDQCAYLNSSPPSAAYMRQWIGSSFVSGNGLSPVRRQAITWINAGLLSIGLLGTDFSEIWIGILSFSLKKIHPNLSSAKMSAILSRGRWVKWYFYTLHSGTSNIKRHCISNYHADSNTTGVPGMITPWGLLVLVVIHLHESSSSDQLLDDYISSSWKYFSLRKCFLPRRNEFFLAEMISLSLKWFLYRWNDFFFKETTFDMLKA